MYDEKSMNIESRLPRLGLFHHLFAWALAVVLGGGISLGYVLNLPESQFAIYAGVAFFVFLWTILVFIVR
jgi:hypothetical protein